MKRMCVKCRDMLSVKDFYRGRRKCKYCIAEENRERSDRRTDSKTPISELLHNWKRVTP